MATRSRIKRNIGYRPRLQQGKVDERTCWTCKSHLALEYHGKKYHKCVVIGMSHSDASDVQKRCFCDVWQEKKEDIHI